MSSKAFKTIVTAMMSGLSAIGCASAARTHEDAWAAWKSGDIATAQARAEEYLAANDEPDEARHLLFLTSFVLGDYEDALAHYDAITDTYASLRELDEPVIEAYLFLRRISDALEFARSRKDTPDWMIEALERHVAKPFKTTLESVSVVPFADHELTDYFPAFSIEINGQSVLAHVDTGGSFLYMGPDRAKALGIETFEGPTERAHLDLRHVSSSVGIIDQVALGDAVLENVPVSVMASLTGPQDFIIFGTRILEPFLSTLDYPNKRLILSPRHNPAEEKAHLEMLPSTRERMPFYLWGDHYMFAKGSVGPYTGLNFFVDSGLVLVHPDANGDPRQVAFTTSKKNFKKWGIPSKDMRKGYFQSPYTLALGPLEQDGHLFTPGQAGDNNFGGVRIDGLISHGFLKQYAWTLDFDEREYTFSSE